ncbi:MAG TPA: hypothetical protein VG014_10720 [Acidimicrobiales bacterium]|nr:hypothetical protein [Acidimicrobiales bacterium]
MDPSTADQLFGGGIVPDDAPPGLRDLAMLIQAAKPLAWTGGGIVEDQVVAAFAATLRTPVDASADSYEAKKRMLTTWLSIKAAAIAAVAAAAVLGGGAAAAAAGSLPGPVQAAVSDALGHVGISVPNPDSRHAPSASSGSTTGNSQGSPTSGGAAMADSQASHQIGAGSAPSADTFSQCTAWATANDGTSTNGTSSNPQNNFPQLTAAASAKGETVAQFCSDVSPPPTATTSPIPSAASSGTGLATSTPGSPSSAPTGPSSTVPAGTPSNTPNGNGPPATTPNGNGPPITNPSGHSPNGNGPPATNPSGHVPGPPASTPSGNVPGGPAH